MIPLRNCILFACVILLFTTPLLAQNTRRPAELFRRNAVGAYIGLIEYNINYERGILRLPKSYVNIRAGFGYFTNLQIETNDVNVSLVYVLGMKSSHAELNLGAKYLMNKAKRETILLPEIYVGYRYERPAGRFIYRTGFAFPSLFNFGTGFKF